ncbi:MAG: DUF4340 domain-containing protein [Gammaproteobacteria bacterium]|nr:MAG: DUF4340 domain-containing protein [Gammaproteobacteria bacterium]
MKRQQLLVLSAMTIVAIVAAGLFTHSRAPQTKIEKETLFPELAGKINDVARIEITSEDRTVILQKQDNLWVLQSADNYPAQFDKIKDTVISLSELKILATKTDKPKLYPELGVEGLSIGDSGVKNSTSQLLILKDKSGTMLASLIIGKTRKSSAGKSRPNLYVRKPDAKNALLVEGYLQIKSHNTDWYERHVIHIPATRIQDVNIVKSNGDHLKINKPSEGETEFKLVEGKTASPSVLLNRLATFFEDMRVDGVHATDSFEFPDGATLTTFTTFNGLVIIVKSFLIEENGEEKAFAHFLFSTVTSNTESTKRTDSGGEKMTSSNSGTLSVEEESRLWNEYLSNWVYEIPGFKFETLDIHVGQSPK